LNQTLGLPAPPPIMLALAAAIASLTSAHHDGVCSRARSPAHAVRCGGPFVLKHVRTAGAIPRSAAVLAAKDHVPPAEAHDNFNIVATSAVATLTAMSHMAQTWNRPLALTMCAYLVLDSIWLTLQPEVAGGTAGGGAITLLGHHLAALIIAVHAATWSLHTPYTCWMSVVEVNTFILMLERRLPGGALVTALMHKLFVGSWVVTRLVWFPMLALRLGAMADYPSLGRRLLCSGCLALLTGLQLVWTWNFCVPPEKQIGLY